MFKRRRRRLIRLCCLAAAARASSPEEEVEVVTLGAMVPPLVSRGRPPGNGAAGRPAKTPTALEEGESPDQTITRLLNAIIERESRQHFHDNQEDLASSRVDDDPVGSSPQEALVGISSSSSSSSSSSRSEDDEGRTAAGEGAVFSSKVDEKSDGSSCVNHGASSVLSAAQDAQPSGDLGGGGQEAGDAATAVADAEHVLAGSSSSSTADSPAEVEVDGVPSSGPFEGIAQGLGELSSQDASDAAAAAAGDAEAASAGESSTDTSSAEAESDAAPFVAHVESAAQTLDGVGDEEEATSSAGESITVGAQDSEEFVDGGEGDATDWAGIDRPAAERGVTAGSREAAQEDCDVPQPGRDTTATTLLGIDDGHVIVDEEEKEKEKEEEEADAGEDAGPLPAARPIGDTHDDGRTKYAAEASAQPTSNDASMDAVMITAEKEEGAAALLAVDTSADEDRVDAGGGEALAGRGGDGATDAARDTSTAETSSMGSQGERANAGGEGQGRLPVVVPTKNAGGQQDDRDVDRLEPDARTSAKESSSDFGSEMGAGVSSGPGDDEATGAVGVDADVAAGANVDGDLEAGPAGGTEIPASEWSGVDARPPGMPSGRWLSPQHGSATAGDAVTAPPDDDVSTSESSQEVEALLLEEEASGEDFPRRRPAFRFSDSLSTGPDPVDVGLAGQRPPRRRHTTDVEDFVVLPPLPPLDSVSAAEPPREASEPRDVMDADSENGWEAWAAESAVALRKAAVRWAGVAAEQGGVLAEELLEMCKAQVVRCWHETVEPLAGYARRRLGATANFCLGEVGQHLEDAVLAEAL